MTERGGKVEVRLNLKLTSCNSKLWSLHTSHFYIPYHPANSDVITFPQSLISL